MAFHDVHQFHKLHTEAQIGFVATIIFHGIRPRHPLERFCQLNTTNFLEKVLCHTFKELDYIVLLYKRHFTVDLCKFRLAVGTEVFVTETFRDLEVAVKA